MKRRERPNHKSARQGAGNARPQPQPPAQSLRRDVESLVQTFLSSSPYPWYAAAFVPIGIGFFMYSIEATDAQADRLRDPVAVVGEFVTAQCATRSKGMYPHSMVLIYSFTVPGFMKLEQGDTTPRLAENFSASKGVTYPSRLDCDAALPAVLAAKAPQRIWYERTQPDISRPTLEEPDSTRFLWLGLGAIPLFGAGWWLRRRRKRVEAPSA